MQIISTSLIENRVWFLSPLKIFDAEKYSVNKVCSPIPSNPYLVVKNMEDVWRVSESPVVCFFMKCGWRMTGCGRLWETVQFGRHQNINIFAHGVRAITNSDASAEGLLE